MITIILSIIIAILLGVIYYLWQQSQSQLKSLISSDEICMDYPNTSMHTMQASSVNNMISNYRVHQLKHINKPTGMNWESNTNVDDQSDSTSIVFNLEVLKKFIYHTEINAIRHGVDNKGLGIKIYYSAYPECVITNGNEKEWGYSDFEGLPTRYEKRHTLVMIPAKLNSDNKYENYNPITNQFIPSNGELELAGGDGSQPIPVLPIYMNTSNNSATQSTQSNSTVQAQNHGTLTLPD